MSINFYNVLQYPWLTDKNTKFSEDGRCVIFKTFSKFNKRTILKAVECLFNVKVKTVNTLIIKKSIVKKNKGKVFRKVSKWKKVIVLLEKNFFINFSQFK